MMIKKACHDIWLRWSKKKISTQERRDIAFLLHLVKSLRKIAVRIFIQYVGSTVDEAKDIADALLEQEMKKIKGRKREIKKKRSK